MGCGCNKRKQQSVSSYTLTMPDGETSTHPSRLDAQKANVKQGGGGKVRPAK